jgi:dynein-related subfamily AAA family protein
MSEAKKHCDICNQEHGGMHGRFRTVCVKCGDAIEVGQVITWDRTTSKRGSYHLTCESLEWLNPESLAAKKAAFKGTSAPQSTELNDVEKLMGGTIPSKPAPVKMESAPSDVFAGFAAALLPHLESKLNTKVDAETVREIVRESLPESMDEDRIREIVAAETAKNTVSIEVKMLETGEVRKLDNVHENFAKLLTYVKLGDNTYLWGGAGSGKSTAAKQVADLLGLPFYFVSLCPQTAESALFGFIRPDGTFQETDFYKAYTQGGIFCADECDNGSPALQTALNSALENGHASFRKGIQSRHANFVFIATGNTTGKGASRQFVGRNPFDGAFADRFTYLNWEVDTKLERKLANAVNENADKWVDWIQAVRKYCAASYPMIQVTPRATIKGAKYLKHTDHPIEEIAEALIFKGADNDTKVRIMGANPIPKISRQPQAA